MNQIDAVGPVANFVINVRVTANPAATILDAARLEFTHSLYSGVSRIDSSVDHSYAHSPWTVCHRQGLAPKAVEALEESLGRHCFPKDNVLRILELGRCRWRELTWTWNQMKHRHQTMRCQRLRNGRSRLPAD